MRPFHIQTVEPLFRPALTALVDAFKSARKDFVGFQQHDAQVRPRSNFKIIVMYRVIHQVIPSLGLVDFYLVVPLSSQFSWGSWKSCRISMAAKQHGRTLKFKSTKCRVWPDEPSCTVLHLHDSKFA